jgi:4-hydroxy-tetrahydrodipicolinate reductase
MLYEIGIIGNTGKVGCSLLNNLDKKEFDIVLKANSKKWEMNKTPTIIINVSSATSFNKVLGFCLDHQIALIEGTSGLNDECIDQLHTAAKYIPVLRAENFSFGHFLQQNIIDHLSGFIKKELNYHLAVNERHSINKKDAPSATAKKLAKICEQKKLNTPTINYMRCGLPVSDHEIHLTMNGEALVVSHGVTDSAAIAAGIVSAIKWLSGKKNGFWTMENVYQQN